MATFRARALQGFALFAFTFGLLLPGTSVAKADAGGALSSYAVTSSVNVDGTISVTAAMTVQGTPPATIRQVIDTVRRTAQDTEYRFTITDILVTAGKAMVPAQIGVGPTAVTIDIPTAGLSQPIIVSYKVRGAALANPQGGTLVTWPMLGGLSVPVKVFTAEVTIPAMFTYLDCEAGSALSPNNCTFYGGGTHQSPRPTFREDTIAAGEMVTISLGFPGAQVAVTEDVRQLWTLERAFSVAPVPLGVAFAVLILGVGALWLAHRKIGRDAAGAGGPILAAEFEPIAAGQTAFVTKDGIRPAEVGTLVDEHVDPIDVTAALLDLAIRGHLVITELPRESAHSGTDWTFTRHASDEPLAGYERILLDAVAPAHGDPVTLSNVPATLRSVMGEVQSELYDEVVARGWFVRRPDSTRNQWGAISWVLLVAATVAAGALIWLTSLGLLGLALVFVALGLVFVSGEMPARTASGTSALQGLEVLRGALLTHPVANLTADDPYGSISVLLPYAVVLGGRDRWLQAMADAQVGGTGADAELGWYRGPKDWTPTDLPASLNNFVTVVQGTLFSR